MNKVYTYRALRHVVFWLIFAFYEYFIHTIDQEGHLERFCIQISLLIGVFYFFAFFILDRFLPKKQFFLGVIATISTCLIYHLILFWIKLGIFIPNATYQQSDLEAKKVWDSIISFMNGEGNMNQNIGFYFLASSYSLVKQLLFSTGYWFSLDALRKEREKKELEVMLSKTELLFLRAQINPHFLYNTLNFLYSTAHSVSKPLGEAILRLSTMMRHTINPKGHYENMSELSREILYIENYIEIQQMRFSRKLHVHYEKEGDFEGRMIPPMILISFVENAFKHGTLDDPENPLFIWLSANDHFFEFSIQNKISSDVRESSSGIGQANIRQRLQLLCVTHGYEFTYGPCDDNSYHVYLKINFS
jgi:two-component system, LytTR family, sensor kinase